MAFATRLRWPQTPEKIKKGWPGECGNRLGQMICVSFAQRSRRRSARSRHNPSSNFAAVAGEPASATSDAPLAASSSLVPSGGRFIWVSSDSGVGRVERDVCAPKKRGKSAEMRKGYRRTFDLAIVAMSGGN